MKLFKRILSVVMAAVMMLSVAPLTAYADEITLPDNEAMRFVDNMGAIWNLGNSLDPYDCTWLSNDLEYETAWCKAKTTEKLIKEIKAFGFDTIRIPVSWHNHVDKNNKINSPWMSRVKEIVDWSVDAGLYVILNVHHDNARGYYFPTADEFDSANKFMKDIWKQIAEEFKDYDEQLIFETINEPRAVGTNHEWWFPINNPSAEVKESVDCVNRLNQTALDTIRAAGGNNKDRFVLVPGYATSVDGLSVEGFELPKDSVKNRLIVDFHEYTKLESKYKKQVDRVYKSFTSKGIPAILTEFNLDSDASKNKYDDTSAEYLAGWVSYAREHGISCAIWDNGDVAYRLIDRATVKWTQEEIAKAIIKAGEPNGKGAFSADDKAENDDKAEAGTEKISVEAKQNGFGAVISWDKVDGASKYRVYRAESKTGKKTLLKTTTSTKYTSYSGTVGTKYYFFVKSYDSASKKWSDYSDAEYLYLKKSNAKTAISKVIKDEDSVKLTWKSVKGGDKYRVYRADSKNGAKTKLATKETLTYTDKSVKSGKTYYYFVRVYDSKTKTWSSYSEAKKVVVP